MPTYSDMSKVKLASCDERIQRLFNEVIEHFDCVIIEGFRPKEKQDEDFHSGLSKLEWPNSKHNVSPSLAVDVAPYPIRWDDTERFCYFAGFVKGIAKKLGIEIRWGGDWDNDMEVKDEVFRDLVHFELR